MAEELLVRYGSPTLAGLKTGSMFTGTFENEDDLKKALRKINRQLSHKGIRLLPLRFRKGRALLYLYRPNKLAADLCCDTAQRLLRERGYVPEQPGRCICCLKQKLQTCREFPHEIGLFLGYPPEDVRGFIDNQAGGYKCVGCWKVYGDEVSAQKAFAKFQKCTKVYCSQFAEGKSIERLTTVV